MTPSGMNDLGIGPVTTNSAPPMAQPKTDTAAMTVPIPLEALAEPDEKSDEMINPEIGDIVNFQVEGKIVSVNGDVAMVEPSAVNGKPLDDGDGDEQEEVSPDDQDASNYSDLESQANQLDQQQQQ